MRNQKSKKKRQISGLILVECSCFYKIHITMAKLPSIDDIENEDELDVLQKVPKTNKFKSRKLKRDSDDNNSINRTVNSNGRVGHLFEDETEDDDIDNSIVPKFTLKAKNNKFKKKNSVPKLADESKQDDNSSKQKMEDYLKAYAEVSSYTGGNSSTKDKMDIDEVVNIDDAEGIILEGSELEDSDIEQLNKQDSKSQFIADDESLSRRKEIEDALQNTDLNDNKEEEDDEEELGDGNGNATSRSNPTKSENILELTSSNLEQSTDTETILQFKPILNFKDQLEKFQTQMVTVAALATKQDLQMNHLIAEQNKITAKHAKYVVQMSQTLRHCR